MKNIIGAFFGLIYMVSLLISCRASEDKRNIEAYYFPLTELLEGKVYEYHPVGNDTLPVEYWYYKTHDLDSGRIFTGTYYDEAFSIRQFFTEEIVANGTLMKDYFLYAFDNTGAPLLVPTEILAPNVYPFEVRDSGGIFLFKLRWTSGKDPEVITTLIRNRRYMGSAKHRFQGQVYDCVAFSLRELIDVHIEGEGHSEPEYEGEELYAKALGLVYYKKEISSDVSLEYELAEVYTMAEFEKKFKQTLDVQ